jgi:hypothetical protein
VPSTVSDLSLTLSGAIFFHICILVNSYK